jgi:hypothetical protein
VCVCVCMCVCAKLGLSPLRETQRQIMRNEVLTPVNLSIVTLWTVKMYNILESHQIFGRNVWFPSSVPLFMFSTKSQKVSTLVPICTPCPGRLNPATIILEEWRLRGSSLFPPTSCYTVSVALLPRLLHCPVTPSPKSPCWPFSSIVLLHRLHRSDTRLFHRPVTRLLCPPVTPYSPSCFPVSSIVLLLRLLLPNSLLRVSSNNFNPLWWLPGLPEVSN